MGQNQSLRTLENTIDPTLAPTQAPYINPSTDTTGKFITPGKKNCATEDCGSQWDPEPAFQMTCDDDDDCRHLDLYNSTPRNPVYMCPDAKCTGEKCDCGASCKYDSYSGSCCQDIQVIGDLSFCVSNQQSRAPVPMNKDEIAFYGIPLGMFKPIKQKNKTR